MITDSQIAAPTPRQPAGPWAQLGPILRPWRGRLALAALCVLLARALDLVPTLLIKQVVDGYLAAGRTDGLLAIGVLFLVATVGGQLLSFAATYVAAGVSQQLLHGLRMQLVAHLQRLPIRFYDQTPTGDLLSRCTADVDQVEALCSASGINVVSNLTRLATTGAAMLVLSPPLTGVALLMVPPLVLLTRHFERQVREGERANRQMLGLLNTELQELLAGAEVVRSFGREAAFVARFRASLRRALGPYNRVARYTALYTPTIAALVTVAAAALLWLSTTPLAVGWGVSIGTLTAFILLFTRFFDPIASLGSDWQAIQGALAGIERIGQVLALPPEVRAAAPPAERAPAAVAVRDLVFGYAPGRPIINAVSFQVQPGELVALVGRTGSGKSSIVQLLGGLYAPWSGELAVAGHAPRSLDERRRRQVIGVVSQTSQVFSATVWENLTLGDREVARDAVERAVALAGAESLIAALPQGYATPLSGTGRSGGVQLSVGQRQLLALARALVWEPAVLVLDEATTAVDSASEAALWAALRAQVQGQRRAVLTVAHRLATARSASRVIVLDGGRIVEEGQPEQLLRRGGHFAALVELETAGWDWERR